MFNLKDLSILNTKDSLVFKTNGLETITLNG